MNQTSNWPYLSVNEVVRVRIALQLALNKEPNCPFDQPLIAELLQLSKMGAEVVAKHTGDSAETLDLQHETTRLYNEVMKLGAEGERTLDPKEKLQWFKTRAGLLEKLLEQQEKAFNQKHMVQFLDTVMGVLDPAAAQSVRDKLTGIVPL